MKKRLYLLPIVCALMILAVFALRAGEAGAADTALRLGGQSRIETALRVSEEGWKNGARTVVIANGYSYPDAMAGVPLAAKTEAPVLLTAGGQPEEAVLERLSRLSARNVLILGGESSVSTAFAEALTGRGYYVERICGADRCGTSVAVAERLLELGAVPEQIFIASGANFPDALSAGPAAGATGSPILYTAADGGLTGDELRFIREAGISRAVILGGEQAVPERIADILRGVGVTEIERVSGADRYQTSLAINRRFDSVLSGTDIGIASGENFPDALSGGAFAAGRAMPVVLINNQCTVPGAYEYLSGRNARATYIFGLEGALSPYAVSTLLAGGTMTTTTTATTTTTPATTTTAASSGGKKAYLTFDDGPSDNTKKILDILDRHGVKATFFVIYRKGYESVYRDIVRRGHTIALHSYTHDYSKIYRSTDAYFSDLEKLSDYVEKVTGVRSNIMRFPGGGSNTVSRDYCRGIMSTLTKEVQKRGYRYYDWNADSGDALSNRVSASKLVANVKRDCGSQKSVIILMHDSPAKTTTVDALPQIISYLSSKGYELLPITEDTPQVHHGVNN